MTREETIKWLESLKAEIGKSEHRTLWHYAEAIDMAVEALEIPVMTYPQVDGITPSVISSSEAPSKTEIPTGSQSKLCATCERQGRCDQTADCNYKPVDVVSRADAIEYCEILIRREGEHPGHYGQIRISQTEVIRDFVEDMPNAITGKTWWQDIIADKNREGIPMMVDYGVAKECKDNEAFCTCFKCGKCGRVFEGGIMVDDGGTTIAEDE